MSKYLDYEGLKTFTQAFKDYIAEIVPDASKGTVGQVLGIKADGTLGFIDVSISGEGLTNVSEAKF